MAALNDCNFIGRLGADPEVRSTPGGDKVVNFSIAVGKKYKGRDGQMVEKTEWINIPDELKNEITKAPQAI